jgi:hypothetical protein
MITFFSRLLALIRDFTRVLILGSLDWIRKWANNFFFELQAQSKGFGKYFKELVQSIWEMTEASLSFGCGCLIFLIILAFLVKFIKVVWES